MRGKRGSDPQTVDVDISSCTPDHGGLRAKDYLKNKLIEFPRLRSLSLFLKQLLKEKHCSDAASGGLRSFALILLLVRFYQRTQIKNPKHSATGVAEDLLCFLDMYGNFDFSEVGICFDGSGSSSFFSLREANMHNRQICCVLWGNSSSSSSNVTENTSRIFSIQQLFRDTRQMLMAGCGLRSLLNYTF